MSWVAVIGTAGKVVQTGMAADAQENASWDRSIAQPGSMSAPTAATYGTQLGNDGWSINFGSGDLSASPSETNSATYPTQTNPLSAVQPMQLLPSPGGIGGLSIETMALLGVGGLVAIKMMRGG